MSDQVPSVEPMKILHTSDWHLGRTLHGVDLHDAQRTFVDHLVQLVQQHDVAAVLVAGDVYDRAIPAVETVRLFSDALRRLSEHTTVVVTPGNHDSAARVGFGAEVMRDSVRILAEIDALDRPVVLHDGTSEIAVFGLPYLDPDAARPRLAGPDGTLPARSHEAVLTAAMDRVRAASDGRRCVVVAHAFVVGAEASDSERDLSVGGVQAVPSGVFDGVDYVALGHLHGPQVVPVPGSTTTARYSGSPLAYSFSEKDHVKSVALVDVTADQPVAVELLPLPVPRPLSEISGSVEHLLSGATDAVVDHWLKVVVTDASLSTDSRAAVHARFGHLLQLVHEPLGLPSRVAAPVVTDGMSPAEVTADFVEFVTARPAADDEIAVARAAYETVRSTQVGA